MTNEDDLLETGWLPGVDPADTVTRRYLFNWAEQCAVFATAAGGPVVRDDRFIATVLPGPGGYFSCAVLLRPLLAHDRAAAAEGSDDLLDEIEAVYADSTGESVMISLWPTPDLRPRGWHLVGHPPMLIRPPASVLPPPPAPEVDVRAVSTVADLERWERVVIDGYPLTQLSDSPPGQLAAPGVLDDPRLKMWVGFDDDVPVSASAMFEAHDLVGFGMAATMPAARRRGFWLRHAVDRLLAAPDLWAAGVFSDYSRPGAESIGFIPIARLTLWSREPRGSRPGRQ